MNWQQWLNLTLAEVATQHGTVKQEVETAEWLNWLILTFACIGTAALALAAIGIVRLPDVYIRLSATTKAATLGLIALLTGVVLHFQAAENATSAVAAEVTTRAIAIVAFVMLTAPVAAHLIGRAAYYEGIELWEGTVADEYGDDLASSEMSAADARRETT